MGGAKALPKSGFGSALSYMIKSYVGPGCLSLPLAFQRSGLGIGMAMLVCLLCIITFNLKSIVLCKHHFEQDGVTTYADLALVTLGLRGKQLIEWLINLTQLGICSVYFDFVAENLNALLPESPLSSVYACMAYSFPIFTVLALLPSVEAISPYTGLANVLIFACIMIVLIYASAALGTNGVGDGIVGARLASCPLFFATAVYSFEGIANMLPVANSLKDGSQVWRLINLSMTCIGFVYAAVGLLSYLAWPHVKAGSITAELSSRVGGPILAASSWMVIVAVIFTFPVQLFPAVELLELRLGFRTSEVHSGESPGAGAPGAEIPVGPSSSALSKRRKGFAPVPGEASSTGSSDSPSEAEFEQPESNGDPEAGCVSDEETQTEMGEALDESDLAVSAPLQGEEETKDEDSRRPEYDGDTLDTQSLTSLGQSLGLDRERQGDGDGVELLVVGSGPTSNGDFTMSPLHPQGGAGHAHSSGEKSILPSSQHVADSHDLQQHKYQTVLTSPNPSSRASSKSSASSTSSASTASTTPARPPAMPLSQKLFRVVLVLATWLAAALVPNLGALIALIGAISGSLLAIILPALIDLRSNRPAMSPRRRLINWSLVVFGTVFGTWGSALALQQALDGSSVD